MVKSLFVCAVLCIMTYLTSGAILQVAHNVGIWPLRINIDKTVRALDRELDSIRPPSWIPPKSFLVDMHTHTHFSSDGKLSPEQLVKMAILNGYSGIAVTDHNTVRGYESCRKAAAELDPNFIIIPGFEWTTSSFHANVYGLTELPKGVSCTSFPSKSDIIRVGDAARRAGGFIQLNHPGDWSSVGLSVRQIREARFDAIEVVSGYWDIRSQRVYDLCNRNGWAITCGSDTHAIRSHPRSYLQILTDSGMPKSYLEVLDAIKRGRTKVHCSHREEVSGYARPRGLMYTRSGERRRCSLNIFERFLVYPWAMLNKVVPRKRI